MKVQSLAVIFAIIVLPVIIILSYYLQASVDTIAIQTSYDTKLIDSTHDAMAAFEINTANENLSSVADSLRSIIEASTNVFFNTLATNLGMSNANKSYIQNYIPAILYTLYDGYYIYSPTRVPEILTAGDEQVVYVGDRGVTYAGSGSIGKYNFNKDEYESDTPEDEGVKSIRQNNLYNALSNKYEYGQMLYKNQDGTYSTVINEDTEYKQDYVLKSYMPYSARYVNKAGDSTEFDLTINYTLDNYLTVEGYIGPEHQKIYYSKTGYLIAKDVIKSINVGGNADLLTYNEDQAEEICLSGEHELRLKIQPIMDDGVTPVSEEIEYFYQPWEENGVRLNSIQLEEKLNKLYDQTSNIALTADELVQINMNIQEIETRLANLKAITYYVKAQIFSNWIYENLGSEGIAIKGNNISENVADLNDNVFGNTNGMDVFHDFSLDNNVIFSADINPEKQDSPFYSHKLNVIKNSVQYNLNLALSVYDIMAREMDIQMPVIKDDEWDKILNNVSVTAFMQGFNCGMKIYNNYAIVSSTNNEVTAIPNEIYYIQKNEYNTSNTSHIYHRIDCPELLDGEYIAFRSKEVKYDKIYDKNSQKYKYDHRNNACYGCIVGSNYLKRINNYNEGEAIMGYSNDIIISALSPNKQKEYYRAVAKERQNLHKTNALTSSNGYEVLFTAASETTGEKIFGAGTSEVILDLARYSTKAIKNIKEIEVTIRDIQSGNKDEATAIFQAKVNGRDIYENLVVNLEQTSPQTIIIPVHIEDNNKLSELKLIKTNPADEVKCNILNVRVIYE